MRWPFTKSVDVFKLQNSSVDGGALAANRDENCGANYGGKIEPRTLRRRRRGGFGSNVGEGGRRGGAAEEVVGGPKAVHGAGAFGV